MDNRPGVDALIGRVPPALRDDPGLLYQRAAWRQRRGRLEGVVELLDALPQSTPQSAAWWRLRNWVVWRALDRRDYALRSDERRVGTAGVRQCRSRWAPDH